MFDYSAILLIEVWKSKGIAVLLYLFLKQKENCFYTFLYIIVFLVLLIPQLLHQSLLAEFTRNMIVTTACVSTNN